VNTLKNIAGSAGANYDQDNQILIKRVTVLIDEASKSGRKFEFSPFRLDSDRRRLLRDDKVVQLGNIPYRILKLLLTHRDKLVPYEAIWKEIWLKSPDRSKDLRSEMNQVNQHILVLRKALGEDFGKCIVNIPGTGYRFSDDEYKQLLGAANRTGISSGRGEIVHESLFHRKTDFKPRIYCADMTQLIAADAYISGLATGRTEPMAASAFEYLTTILCNDTVVFFEKPKVLTLRNPVIRAWHDASLESQKETLKPLAAAVDPSVRHKVMAGAFARFAKGDRYLQTSGFTNAQILAGWTRYQLSDETLQEQYWSTNTVDEMLAALEGFSQAQNLVKGNKDEIREILSRDSIVLSEASRSRWGNRPALDFYLAWSYWSFLKGYRYALKIPDRGIYVCHWLREDACVEGVPFTTVGEKTKFLEGLFPWGIVLTELVTFPGLATSADDIYNIIMKLREYTRSQCRHLAPLAENVTERLDELWRNTRAFLRGALAHIAPPGWERHFKGTQIEQKTLAQLASGPLGLVNDWAELRKALELAIPQTEQPGKKTNITQTLMRIDRYRETANHFVARYRTRFERFWNEHGWI
jgi:DNA-binding winged helix-turn-helix (wHTH) protein